MLYSAPAVNCEGEDILQHLVNKQQVCRAQDLLWDVDVRRCM